MRYYPPILTRRQRRARRQRRLAHAFGFLVALVATLILVVAALVWLDHLSALPL